MHNSTNPPPSPVHLTKEGGGESLKEMFVWRAIEVRVFLVLKAFLVCVKLRFLSSNYSQ